MRPGTSRTLLWGAALVPVLVAIAGLPAQQTAGAGAVLNAAGRLAGIAGLAMLLMAAALSARVPGFDRHFGGLTKLWHTHHLLGAGSLLLLLIHPLLLALTAAGHSTGAAVATLFPPVNDVATWLGWAALVLMMVFLAPSFAFFGEPEFSRWKRVHRLAGPAVILALGHTFLFGRTMPGYWDTGIWSAMAVLAVGAVGYRFVFSRRIGRLRHTVDRVEQVANNVVELTLRPDGRALAHRAGQFVYLTPRDRSLTAGYDEEHPYTLSSAPHEPGLRIAIKDLGDASRAIQTIREGSEVWIEGPYGAFFPDDDATASELWIAGGIGVTPFLGRARHLAHRCRPVDIHLVHCMQDEPRAIFLEELLGLSESLPGFTATPHYFYCEGPLSAAFLADHCPDYADRIAYVCGPDPLNRLAQERLRAAGVPVAHIHTEEFTLL